MQLFFTFTATELHHLFLIIALMCLCVMVKINTVVCLAGCRNRCEVSGQEWSHSTALGQSTAESAVPQHHLQLFTAEGGGHAGQQTCV